ncbi:uncharacterized protein LOC131018026 isoform X2 [Salvia miltiorrhiza]|uniref:uncharacterized protein LOC131018026 isoform X2 n=1 Tax=Salvia miltiorrhiza TaxID=226208 RepID=UPI0025ACAAE3|nr:uncharacterized protein LOC131018026 isoform X2 [Salvia miltiorrhiza]
MGAASSPPAVMPPFAAPFPPPQFLSIPFPADPILSSQFLQIGFESVPPSTFDLPSRLPASPYLQNPAVANGSRPRRTWRWPMAQDHGRLCFGLDFWLEVSDCFTSCFSVAEISKHITNKVSEHCIKTYCKVAEGSVLQYGNRHYRAPICFQAPAL